MNRKVLLWGMAALLLVALAVAGFFAAYERVPTKRHEDAGPEALRNPYLALERFMARMGQPVRRSQNANDFDNLPAGGVLILDGRRSAHLTKARQQKLFDWVAQGGYLILAPETGKDDPLLLAFGLCRTDPEQACAPKTQPKSCRPGSHDDDDDDRPTQVIYLPGSEHGLWVDAGSVAWTPKGRLADWIAEDEFGTSLIHLRSGQGQVSILHLHRFTNEVIGQHDEAELLWSLIDRYQSRKGAPVLLMTRLTLPSLWQWLGSTGLGFTVAGAVLLVLWLWRIGPRFGPLLPPAEPDRRQLREHLAAIGRYVWRAGGLNHWLTLSREAFFKRLALRQPAIAQLPADRQVHALSRLSHYPAERVAACLFDSLRSPHDFTLAIRTLRQLERCL